MQRRHYLLLLAAGLAVILLSLLLRGGDRYLSRPDPAPPARPGPDRAVDGHTSDHVPAADRLPPAFGSLRCTGDVAGALMAVSGTDIRRSNGLSLAVPPGEWAVYLESDDAPVPLGRVEVEAGDALTCVLYAGFRPVRGRVLSTRGRPVGEVDVRATCEGSTRLHAVTDSRGAFTVELPARGCDLTATIRTGALVRESDPVHVTPFDQDVEVEISLDDRPVAGLGIALFVEDGGVRVQEVQPGTPAEESGMQAGDLITAIDGTSIVGLSADQFRNRATGEEGTWVSVEVQREGARRQFRFRRRQIAAEARPVPGPIPFEPPFDPSGPPDGPPPDGPPPDEDTG